MSTTTALAPNQPAKAGKYLTVQIAEEAYGIEVLRVREIIRLQKITHVPQLPEYVRGVINLRGRVIPVVDLRIKFGLPSEFADRTCIVVVQVRVGDAPAVPMGMVVDSVEEVVNLGADQIEAAPDFGVKLDPAYISGMAKVNGQVKTLLDIDCVVASEALRQIVAAA